MKQIKKVEKLSTELKRGDLVMVIAGGHKVKRPYKGKTGVIREFVGKNRDRVIVEGVNMRTFNQKQTGPDKPAGRVEREASIHISNVMFYVEKISKAVRLKKQFLEDGSKVRGYANPENGEFVQI